MSQAAADVPVIFMIGCFAWTATACTFLVAALWLLWQAWRRSKNRLPCDHKRCPLGAEWVFVDEDEVRGLCDLHWRKEQKESEKDDRDREEDREDRED